MSKITCPACGSDNVLKNASIAHDRISDGPEFSYQKEYYVCNDCSEEGDFAQVNSKKYLEKYNEALAISVKQLISDLPEKHEISMAFFERAFELPMRTLTRWKNGEFSATAVALLRTVNTYPWLIEVAENRFEVSTANKIILREGWGIFCKEMETKNMYPERVSVETGPLTIVAEAKFKATNLLPRTVGESL